MNAITCDNKNTSARMQRFNALLEPYASHPDVLRMKNYVQHGAVSTYEHCVHVADTSYRLAGALHLQVDEQDLVAGAFLHDFCLYDWHDRAHAPKAHATRHPLYAEENAKRIFGVNKQVCDIISSHMWPLPPNRLPKSKEAAIVCIADKWVSLTETLFRRKANKV